jgi:uncharacterized protein RhaS with RHS repeats
MKRISTLLLSFCLLLLFSSYSYARYYEPQTGRYLTPDPIGLKGGINPYVYVQNNPVNLIDPEGLLAGGPALGVAVVVGGGIGLIWIETAYPGAIDRFIKNLLYPDPTGGGGNINDNGNDIECGELPGFHGHHSDPIFMGGDTNQPLVQMSAREHMSLHRDLNRFLRTRTDRFGNHMRPQRNNSGQEIRQNFSRQERLEALRDFYRGPGSKYENVAKDFFRQHPGF